MESLDEKLRRLKLERDEADRLYNEALTALDRSFPPASPLPSPKPALDDHRLAALNQSWDLQLSPPPASGWKGRLGRFIWHTIAPFLQRQLAFNSQLVDHLNRNAAAARGAQQISEQTVARLRDDFAKLAEFHTRMLVCFQQITAYVDTRDRDVAGGNLILNASLSGLAENLDKRWETLSVRDKRLEARTAGLAAGQADLRAMLAVSQQAALSLKREVERLLDTRTAVASGPLRDVEAAAASRTGAPAFRTLDSYKYVGFEDQFRGSREVVRARLESYLPFFRESGGPARPVLDVGCGRGEFLEILGAAGVPARGIDLNHEMVEVCKARGLDVTEADAVGHLSSLPDASLGGLFAAQVVEHLQPGYLLQFLELAFHKVQPGGRVVLETLNPACWVAFFESYIRDITHAWPLHPETLKYLVLASGFTRADIEYRSPVPPQDRLQTIAAPAAGGVNGPTDSVALGDLVETFNANVEKLNARIFTHLDYAVIGAR